MRSSDWSSDVCSSDLIGVFVALLIDLALRITRALLVEREAQKIDTETSEFFFARAQSVRLDARSMGVGTMASQLRGLEQVRGVMSASSLFLIADLPFAGLLDRKSTRLNSSP